jgi:rhomboid family GlyGly-CTERM serine protease
MRFNHETDEKARKDLVRRMNAVAALKLRTSEHVRANNSMEATKIPSSFSTALRSGDFGSPVLGCSRPFKGGGVMLLAILGMAVVASATPLAAEAWEYNRESILHGEWSRLLTGHLTHWNFDHLFWDAATFLLLGIACVWRSLGRTVTTLLGAAVAISASLLLFQPEMATYRGLSGLDSALFTLLAAMIWRESRRDGRWKLGAVAIAAGAGFLAKAAYESATGTTLFVDSSAAGFIPLASAHLIGGAVGAIVGLGGRSALARSLR